MYHFRSLLKMDSFTCEATIKADLKCTGASFCRVSSFDCFTSRCNCWQRVFIQQTGLLPVSVVISWFVCLLSLKGDWICSHYTVCIHRRKRRNNYTVVVWRHSDSGIFKAPFLKFAGLGVATKSLGRCVIISNSYSYFWNALFFIWYTALVF